MQVLQSLIELQKDISAIGTKTDRLISDHAKLDSRVASIAETLTFIKGAAFAATMLIPVCAALVGG